MQLFTRLEAIICNLRYVFSVAWTTHVFTINQWLPIDCKTGQWAVLQQKKHTSIYIIVASKMVKKLHYPIIYLHTDIIVQGTHWMLLTIPRSFWLIFCVILSTTLRAPFTWTLTQHIFHSWFPTNFMLTAPDKGLAFSDITTLTHGTRPIQRHVFMDQYSNKICIWWMHEAHGHWVMAAPSCSRFNQI